MLVIRDDKKIARLRLFGQITSFLGLAILIGGMLLIFFGDPQEVFLMQMAALFVGWLLSQVGLYFTQRFSRRPRADEVLDEALTKVAKDGRIYHYVLPAPHVLLLPSGIIVIVAKYQGGKISADGDKWQQSGIGLKRFFGQEGIGNPSKDADHNVAALAHFLKKNVPQVEEVPIAALIVFTTKGVKDLDLKRSSSPAMHATKAAGYLKQNKGKTPMPAADYEAIRQALDEKAGVLANEAFTA
jgi:hypothetical protein